MDINVILQAIGSVGFPIAMCIMMAYYIKSLQSSHKEEMDSVKDAINNLTIEIQKLVDAYKKKEDL